MKAIVMGATSGIGMEVAKALAAKGWEVGIAGRRQERLEALRRVDKMIVAARQIDINADNAPALLTSLIQEMGGIDLYFHSSGIGWQNGCLDASRELLTVETNCTGFVRMTTAAFNWLATQAAAAKASGTGNLPAPHLHIACITSIAGTKGLGAAPAYSATKRFQSHYLESLAQLAHMRRLSLAVTDIRPGFVATDLIAGSNFPMQMSAENVAEAAVRAIEKGRRTAIIDWRYRLLVGLWRLIPGCLWTRLNIGKQ